MVTSPFSPGKPSPTFNPAPEKISSETLALQMGDAVIAATETVTCLADRMEELAHSVQQQGYQIFALTEEVQNLTLLHQSTLDRLETLMAHLASQHPDKSLE
jgi:hypothetical protein